MMTEHNPDDFPTAEERENLPPEEAWPSTNPNYRVPGRRGTRDLPA
jgi:hypothetical protein